MSLSQALALEAVRSFGTSRKARLLPSTGVDRLRRYYERYYERYCEPFRLPLGPACPSRAAGSSGSNQTPRRVSRGCVPIPLSHAVVTTPAGRPTPGCSRRRPRSLSTPAFPVRAAGRLSQLAFSRLARRSLALRPAHSLTGPKPAFDVPGSRRPGLPTARLLPIGQDCFRTAQPPLGMGLAPTGPTHLTRRTHAAQASDDWVPEMDESSTGNLRSIACAAC